MSLIINTLGITAGGTDWLVGDTDKNIIKYLNNFPVMLRNWNRLMKGGTRRSVSEKQKSLIEIKDVLLLFLITQHQNDTLMILEAGSREHCVHQRG